MRRAAGFSAFLLFLFACGSNSSGPSAPDAIGTWIVTFTSGQSCQVSQLSLILAAGGQGDWGAVAVSCPGKSAVAEGPGKLVKWSESGTSFGVEISVTPAKQLYQGVVAKDSITGHFQWTSASASYPTITGTFVAHRQ